MSNEQVQPYGFASEKLGKIVALLRKAAACARVYAHVSQCEPARVCSGRRAAECAVLCDHRRPGARPNGNLIGFWASDRDEVDRMAALVEQSGGTIHSGPQFFPISPTYYAVYFQDPCGNRYEIVHRLN